MPDPKPDGIKTFYVPNGDRHYEHPLAFEPPDRVPFTGHAIGVTSVLNSIAKPFILSAATKMVATYAVKYQAEWQALPNQASKVDNIKRSWNRYTGEASDLGTEVHDITERVSRWVFEGAEKPVVPEHLKSYADSYIRFLLEMKATPVMLERVAWNHTLGYAGRFDGIFDMGGKLCMIDTKSGKSGTWPEVALQQAGYINAEVLVNGDGSEEPMPEVEEAYALWLRPEGYALKPLKIGKNTWDTFQACLQVVKWQTEFNATVIGPAINPAPITGRN
jgi:hypothetical protein